MRRLAVALTATFLASGFVPSVATAQKAAAKNASSGEARDGVAATVVTDGALIYLKPDFDSTVINQLPRGQRVQISKGTAGNEVRFHKIRIGKRVGYIADIDVSIGAASAAAPSAATRAKPKRPGAKAARGDRKREEREPPSPKKPIYWTRFVGVLVGMTEFEEGISGVNTKTSFPIYGLKVTGPDVLVTGPVIDFNLALHYGAPEYYEPLSEIRPIGFVLFADALLMLPVVNKDDALIYLAGGPMVVLSKFSVINAGRAMDLTALNLGADLALGAAYRTGKVAIRLEGKYTYEKHQYKSVLLSLQGGF